MAWALNGDILTQSGVDTNIDGIPSAAIASTVTATGPGTRSTFLNTNVRVVITGQFFHNMEEDRLVVQYGQQNRNGSGIVGFHVSGPNAQYWTARPIGSDIGATLPASATDGDVFVRTDGTVHRRESGAWVQLPDDQLAQLRWTGGSGLDFNALWTWFGGSFTDTATPHTWAFALSGGARFNASGGRITGAVTAYFGRGGSGNAIPFIDNYGTFAFNPVAYSASGTDSGPPNDISREPIYRFFSSNLNLLGNFSIQGGSFTLGARVTGTFNINRSFGGWAYGFQQHVSGTPPFNPASTTSYPTVRNVSVQGNQVDWAIFENATNVRAGQRLQNIAEGTASNANGLESAGDAQQRNNAGYTWMTRQIQTGIARAQNDIKSALTVQGVIYCTDTDNNNRELSTRDTAQNDAADTVYTIRFDDTITDYAVTGGTAAGILALEDEREILLAVQNVNRTGGLQIREPFDTGRWRWDRRGNSNVAGEDQFTFDIWSYEQEYTQRVINLTDGTTGDVVFGGVIANDAFVSRPRAMALGINNVVASINNSDVTSYSMNSGGSLSDIYDFVKYQKETNGSYRNVPNVTSLPLSASGTTLDLGTRTLNVIGTLTGTSVLNTVTMGNASLAGDITDATITSTSLAVGGIAPTYTNSRFNIDNTLILVENTTFNGFTFNTNENISNFGTHLTIGENGLHFQQSTTLSLDNGLTGTIASGDLFTGITIEPTHSLDIITTNTAGVTIEFPLGTTINNGTVSFGGGTIAAGQNVTFAAVQPAATQPTLVRIDLSAQAVNDTVRVRENTNDTGATVRTYTIPASNAVLAWSSAVTTGGTGTILDPWPLLSTTTHINYTIAGVTSTMTGFRHTVVRATTATDAPQETVNFITPARVGNESANVAPSSTITTGRDVHVHIENPIALGDANVIVIDMAGFTYTDIAGEAVTQRAFAEMRPDQDYHQAIWLQSQANSVTFSAAGTAGLDVMQFVAGLYVNMLGGAYEFRDLEPNNQYIAGVYDTGANFLPRATENASLQINTPGLGTDTQEVYSVPRRIGLTTAQLDAALADGSGGITQAQLDAQTGAIIGNIYGAS